MKTKNSLGSKQDATAKAEVRGGSTPGPWHYQEDSDAYTHIVRDSADRYICGCSQDSGGNAEANARLIAATPELLDATKRAYQAFSNILEFRIIHDPDKREAVRDIVAQLSSALIKAEGTTFGTRTTHPNPADQPNSNTKEP